MGGLAVALAFAFALTACDVVERSGETDPSANRSSSSPPAAPNPGFEMRSEKTRAMACLPELPPGAEEALVAVQKAAAAGDLAALRRWMVDDFSWSFGGDASAEQAVRHWRERPEVLRELDGVLERGCLADETGRRVTCPPEYTDDPGYLGWRAGFERREAGWRMTFFIAGD